MAGATKLLTAGGGGVILTPASSIASDVTVQIPAANGTVITTASTGKVIPTAALPAGSVVQVQNSYGSSTVTVANSGSGRVYTDLLTLSYTPKSASNKIIVIATIGFTAASPITVTGAFGNVFDINGTQYEFGDFPWYSSGVQRYPGYPPDSTITRTIDVPTGSAFNIKLRGYAYNEASGTMTISFLKYQLTVIEVAV